MITRSAKMLLLAGVALFYTLVVFNNLTDFDSNYQFVRHVLTMDTTFPGNNGNVARDAVAGVALAFYYPSLRGRSRPRFCCGGVSYSCFAPCA